ncbi:hypothetical protein AAMO2058_000304100 [Amorphochlora amoebiformis]
MQEMGGPMQKIFHASARGRIRVRQYRICIDVGQMKVSFTKGNSTKSFSMIRCSSLKTSKAEPKEINLKLESEGKSRSYHKVFRFNSRRDRDNFYKIFRMALTAGEKAVETFKTLAPDSDGLISAPANLQDLKKELLSDESILILESFQNLNAGNQDRVDFFRFLELYTEALVQGQTRTSRRDSLGLGVVTAFGEYEGRAQSHCSNDSKSTDGTSVPMSLYDVDITDGEDGDGGSLVLLEGEGILQGESSDIALRTDKKPPGRGRFILTSYRIAYLDTVDPKSSFFVPHAMIKSFDILNPSQCKIETRDFRAIELKFINARGPKLLTSVLRFVNNRGIRVFAFFHKPPVSGPEGWTLTRGSEKFVSGEGRSRTKEGRSSSKEGRGSFKEKKPEGPAEVEYRRLGLLGGFGATYFRVFENRGFLLCDTYPKKFCVPKALSDEKLKEIARYRSRGRIPAVVWIHPTTGATLARCAQPLTGIFGGRCKDDELMVNSLSDGVTGRGKYLRDKYKSKDEDGVVQTGLRLVILDARPWKAAMGNSVLGKGTENAVNYVDCALEFAKIDNIHAVRASLESLMSLCRKTVNGAEEQGSPSWYAELEDTKWMHFQSLLLTAAERIKHLLKNGVCVLVHCSDGWDRTAQLVGLAMLLLDPTYRTMEGFAKLVERQWCSFGHKFAERCGHYKDSTFKENQQAPIFLQFLEAVWQILRQHPSAFEFNSKFLAALAFHCYSCRFGTFLFNNDKMRDRYRVRQETTSVWTHLLAPQNRSRYINSSYYLKNHSSLTQTASQPLDKMTQRRNSHKKNLSGAKNRPRSSEYKFGVILAGLRSGSKSSKIGQDLLDDAVGDEIKEEHLDIKVNCATYALAFWESFHMRRLWEGGAAAAGGAWAAASLAPSSDWAREASASEAAALYLSLRKWAESRGLKMEEFDAEYNLTKRRCSISTAASSTTSRPVSRSVSVKGKPTIEIKIESMGNPVTVTQNST